MMKSSLILAAGLGSTNAFNYFSCFTGQGFEDKLLAYATSIADGNASTDCYTAAEEYSSIVQTLTDEITNFSKDSLFTSFKYVYSVAIELTDYNVACKSTLISEQLTPRLSTLGGALNLIQTLVQGFFAWSPLFSEGIDGMMTATTCGEFGTASGSFWRELVVYIAPDSVFFDLVDNDVQDQNNN